MAYFGRLFPPQAALQWLSASVSPANSVSCCTGSNEPVRRSFHALSFLLPHAAEPGDCLARGIARELLRHFGWIAIRTARLFQTAKRIRPRLLLLDPLVRLHGIDENHATEVAQLLTYFRSLQRRLDVSVVLVHHTRKNAAGGTTAGVGVRGSSDIHGRASRE